MGENLFDTKKLYQRDVEGIWKPITVTTNSPFTTTKFINDTLKELNEQLKVTVPLPERYIINENACILFWKNGEKTVVKRCADDDFNPRLAFLTAFFQHYVDMSKNKANKYLANLQVEVKEVEPTQKPKHMKEKMIFKVGDRVEVVKKDDWSKKGWKGRITKIDMDDMLQIKVKYDNGEEWWIAKEQIKLIKEGK